jgi:rhamnogalacturonyl hydrolase YesR
MPIERAVRLVDAHLARRPAHTLRWDWEDAILLAGVDALRARAPHLTGALVDYHRAWIRRGLPRIDRSDACAPALTALSIASALPCAMASAERVAAYLTTAPRNALGAIDHLGSSPLRLLYPRSIWVDSLMMHAVFAARFGAATNDAALVDFAASQPIVYAAALQDRHTGLFRHAWLVRRRRAVPGGHDFWLRGNGWALASIAELLEVLSRHHAHRAKLATVAERIARALSIRQKGDGAWDLLSGDDTSGVAIVAYALAKLVRLGAIDAAARETAARAFAYADARVIETSRGPSIRGVTGPTNALPAFTYRFVGTAIDAPYGIGAYALAASEMARDVVRSSDGA